MFVMTFIYCLLSTNNIILKKNCAMEDHCHVMYTQNERRRFSSFVQNAALPREILL